MVMIEAMTVGCPAIAFARGSAPEIVSDGQSGFLTRYVDEMVECIKRIDLLDRSQVRAYAEAHFSARVMAERYLALYHQVRADALLAAQPGMVSAAPVSDDAPELISA